MRDPGQKKSLGDLTALLCVPTLKSSLRTAADATLPAREGLKELLATSAPAPSENHPSLPSPSAPSSVPETAAESESHEFSRWERCLDLLVEELVQRKTELTRLNKARKEQIEIYLRQHAEAEITLEQAVQGRVGSLEREALMLFANQAAVFQLLQLLLVKRWVDRGLLPDSSLKPTGHTLNWQITGFLKKNTRQGLIGRHDWAFLKQNIFSWYSPLKETWERLRLLLEPVSLAQEDSDFPARLLRFLGARSRLALLGFSPALIDSRALWSLLLEQKAADERLPDASHLDFSSGAAGAIAVSGLGNGESLNSLRELSCRRELHGVWAYTDSDFERFLSEMFILWDCASEIPRINLHPRSVLKDLERPDRGASLFQDSARVPHQAQFAACFQDEDGKELQDAVSLLASLRENGLMLVASDQFWPTDSSSESERLRELALKHSAIRLIIDLRQLTGSAGERLPKGIAILERTSSQEVRDSNRPHLLRARGHLQAHQVQAFWQCVLEQVRAENTPGEVNVKSFSSLGDGIRLESMAAAASQQQLRSTPWVTLSDPLFYDASNRLKRSLYKAHTFGSILRWRPGLPSPSRRGIVLREHGRFLEAELPENASAQGPDVHQFLFLPDSSVAENSLFFLAQVYSAPVQFWFRLESEQNTAAKKVRGNDRQSEQRLKLMPLLRLFEANTLLPAPPAGSPSFGFASLEEARHELTRIFRSSSRGMAENSRIHGIVLGLEQSITQNIELCAEFTRHLFPGLQILRGDLPSVLPEVSSELALGIFRHLDSSPLAHHPALQITRFRTAQDFKVTNTDLQEMPLGGHAELKVFHGIEPALKIIGPSIILRSAHEELQKRIGRPWKESSERMRYPTDIRLVTSQLREVVRSAENQLNTTREYIALMDQIFCCLFGLSSNFTDESMRQAIRHHLSPHDSRVNVKFAREAGPVKLQDFEAPIGILQ